VVGCSIHRVCHLGRDRCRGVGHQRRRWVVSTRLAYFLRPFAETAPMGGRYRLRAQSPYDCVVHGLVHHRDWALDVVRGTAPLDESPGLRCSRNYHSARNPRRDDGAALSPSCDFERTCRRGSNLLFSRRRDCCLHWTQVGARGSAATSRLWPAEAAGVVSLLHRRALCSADFWRNVPPPWNALVATRSERILGYIDAHVDRNTRPHSVPSG